MTKARNIADLLDANGDVKSGSLDNVPAVDLTNLSASNLTSGTIPDARVSSSAVNQHATDYDDNTLKSNVALLGFKTASSGSLAKFNLQDQVVDEFIDNSGIDTGNSTNATISGSVASSGTAGNYFGTGGDGDVTISSNTNLTVSNTNGSYDGDMVFKQYNTLTINSGQTLTTNVPCRGLFIYVKGNCTINGTIDMTARGAYANPASTSSPSWGNAGSDGNTLGVNGLQLGLVKSGSSQTLTNDGTGFNGCGTAVRTAIATYQNNISGNGKIYSIARTGASGASGAHSSQNATGVTGTSGASSNQTGGGGSGAPSNQTNKKIAGNGASGSCWSGGSGGVGIHNSEASGAGHATANGGAGGSGDYGGNAGGAGNPGGSGNGGHGGTGETGTGGTVWLIVGGTLSGSGTIRANGKNGGAFISNTCGGGGASGGGAIIVASVADTSSITVQANGGTGTTGGSGDTRAGGNGGAGYAIRETGISGLSTFSATMSLLSNATTAQAVPTKSDLIVLMKNVAGTATLNTDIKGYVSRDGGSTFTQGTLVDEGSYGDGKILAVHDLDISSQPSGTSMKYKIELANQASGSKQTNVQGCSIGWK